jgi:hypothetical protein
MVFGLSKDKQATETKPADTTKKSTSDADDTAADEAQQLLEEMQAKEDSGDCAFC